MAERRRRERAKAWGAMLASPCLQIACGHPATFPLYSLFLQKALNYDQHSLLNLGLACRLGESFGMPAGLFSRWPRVLLLMGCVLCFCGYGTLWLALSQGLRIPNVWIWIAMFLATNSIAWVDTGVLITNIKNFPARRRGTVSGILRGYKGLGGAIYTLLFTGLLHNSPTGLLLSLALGTPIICLVAMYFVRPCVEAAEEYPGESRYFIIAQVASILLGVYALLATIVDSTLSPNNTWTTMLMFGVLIIVLALPVVIIALGMLFSEIEDPVEIQPLINQQGQENPPADDDASIWVLGVQFLKVLWTLNFWLLFGVFFVGVGSGVTVLNNMAQIGTAAGFKNTSILLCVFSFFNFLGRLGVGYVSDQCHFIREIILPRPIWMTLAEFIMFLNYLLFAFGNQITICVSTALLGICYGVHFSVMGAIASDLFDLNIFWFIYNAMLLANPLGVLIFSYLIAAHVYTEEVKMQHTGRPTEMTCSGSNCYKVTFFVLAGVCFVGTLLSAFFTWKVVPRYRELYAIQGGNDHIHALNDGNQVNNEGNQVNNEVNQVVNNGNQVENV